MSLESSASKNLMKALKKGGLAPRRVENMIGKGTPDIALARCHIETKSKDEWPKRPATPLRLPHWSTDQGLWQFQHHQAGGWGFVVLKVARDWMLLDGMWCFHYLGKVNRETLISNALWHDTKLNGEDLVECLKSICFPERNCTCSASAGRKPCSKPPSNMG